MPDLSLAEQAALLRKHERAMRLRQQFLKETSNPHRHALGEGGTLFDPQIYRFQALRANLYQNFRPTVKTFFIGMCIVVLPMIAFAKALSYHRDGREHQFRTGQVAYKDRIQKYR